MSSRRYNVQSSYDRAYGLDDREIRRQQDEREYSNQRRRSRSPPSYDNRAYRDRYYPGHDDRQASQYYYDRGLYSSDVNGYSSYESAPRTEASRGEWQNGRYPPATYTGEQSQRYYSNDPYGPPPNQSYGYGNDGLRPRYREEDRIPSARQTYGYAGEDPRPLNREDPRKAPYITPRQSSYRDEGPPPSSDRGRDRDEYSGNSRLAGAQRIPSFNTAPSHSSSTGQRSPPPMVGQARHARVSDSYSQLSKKGRPGSYRRADLRAGGTARTPEEADWKKKQTQSKGSSQVQFAVIKPSVSSVPPGQRNLEVATRAPYKTIGPSDVGTKRPNPETMKSNTESKLRDTSEAVSKHPSDDSNKNSNGRSNAGLSKASIERASKMSNKALNEGSIEAAATVKSEVEHNNDKIEIAGGALVDDLCDILASEGDEPAVEDFTNVSNARINSAAGADDVEDVNTKMPDTGMLDIDSGVIDLTVDEYEPLPESNDDDMGYIAGGKHSTASKSNKFNKNA